MSYFKMKNKFLNPRMMLIYIAVISILIINITMARYASSSNIDSEATFAAWDFKVRKGDAVLAQQFTINLHDTTDANENIKSGVIAPGSTGSFSVGIDCSGCEVGVQYTIELEDSLGALPNGIKFYTTPNFLESSQIVLGSPYQGIINLEEISEVRTETIYWTWVAVDSALNNQSDTVASNDTFQINMNIEGQQMLAVLRTDETFFDISQSGVLTLDSLKLNEFRSSITDLNLPTTINGIEVTEIGTMAFANMENLNSVTINSDSITIDASAFSGCHALTGVVIHSNNITMGDNAFDECTSLRTISFAGTVDTIGKWAFRNCSSLYNFVMPSGVTSIGEAAFSGCESLTSISLPSTVSTINKWTFINCLHLTSINIPENILTIQEGALANCTSLATVNFANGLTTIGESVFYNCTTLHEITLPNSVTSIANYAFQDCINLTTATIPQTATVAEYAFYGCTNLND